MTYADWLKAQRRKMGLTQAQLAERAGLGRTYINNIENGRVNVPTKTTRAKLHNVFGSSDDELVDYSIIWLGPDGQGYPVSKDDFEFRHLDNLEDVPDIDLGFDGDIESEATPMQAKLIALIKQRNISDLVASTAMTMIASMDEAEKKITRRG